MAVTLSGNRMAPDVNFTMIAASLEGYTGSDIKEVRGQLVVLEGWEGSWVVRFLLGRWRIGL